MRGRAAGWVFACLPVTGCVSPPQTFAPDQDRRPLSVEEPSTLKSHLRMNEPGASLHFIRDISPVVEGDTWRWTAQRPTLMLAAPKANGLKFAAQIAVPEISLKITGPVVIAVRINGHELGKYPFATAGDKRIEQAVPDGWLRVKSENIVEMEIDKVRVREGGLPPFGFVLTSAGFVE